MLRSPNFKRRSDTSHKVTPDTYQLSQQIDSYLGNPIPQLSNICEEQNSPLLEVQPRK